MNIPYIENTYETYTKFILKVLVDQKLTSKNEFPVGFPDKLCANEYIQNDVFNYITSKLCSFRMNIFDIINGAISDNSNENKDVQPLETNQENPAEVADKKTDELENVQKDQNIDAEQNNDNELEEGELVLEDKPVIANTDKPTITSTDNQKPSNVSIPIMNTEDIQEVRNWFATIDYDQTETNFNEYLEKCKTDKSLMPQTQDNSDANILFDQTSFYEISQTVIVLIHSLKKSEDFISEDKKPQDSQNLNSKLTENIKDLMNDVLFSIEKLELTDTRQYNKIMFSIDYLKEQVDFSNEKNLKSFYNLWKKSMVYYLYTGIEKFNNIKSNEEKIELEKEASWAKNIWVFMNEQKSDQFNKIIEENAKKAAEIIFSIQIE